jgi:hypothetical protein
MPRYYFDAWNGERIAQDNQGVECADDQAARNAAARALLDLAKDIVSKMNSCELSIEVSDESKKPVCRATLQFEIEHLGERAAETSK